MQNRRVKQVQHQNWHGIRIRTSQNPELVKPNLMHEVKSYDANLGLWIDVCRGLSAKMGQGSGLESEIRTEIRRSQRRKIKAGAWEPALWCGMTVACARNRDSQCLGPVGNTRNSTSTKTTGAVLNRKYRNWLWQQTVARDKDWWWWLVVVAGSRKRWTLRKRRKPLYKKNIYVKETFTFALVKSRVKRRNPTPTWTRSLVSKEEKMR